MQSYCANPSSYQLFIFMGKLATSTREYDATRIADPDNATL